MHDKHYSIAWIFTNNWRILFSYVHVDIYIDRKWKNLHAFAQRRKNRYRKLKMMLQTIKEQLSQEHKCYEYICFLVLIIERLISECTFRGPKKKSLTVNHAHCHLHSGLRGHRCADGGGDKETTSSADREVPQMKKEN